MILFTKHVFELCFWLRNFPLIEKKNVIVKQIKTNA